MGETTPSPRERVLKGSRKTEIRSRISCQTQSGPEPSHQCETHTYLASGFKQAIEKLWERVRQVRTPLEAGRLDLLNSNSQALRQQHYSKRLESRKKGENQRRRIDMNSFLLHWH